MSTKMLSAVQIGEDLDFVQGVTDEPKVVVCQSCSSEFPEFDSSLVEVHWCGSCCEEDDYWQHQRDLAYGEVN